MKFVSATSLGCKVSAYDAEAILKLFRDAGYVAADFEGRADVIIINTCAVTGLSERKSRQAIRRAVSLNPGALIIAAGCYPQIKPEEAAKIPGVSLVIGTAGRGNIVTLAENVKPGSAPAIAVTDLTGSRGYERLGVDGHRGRTRAYLKIEDGCENFCSYCVVPYARGAVRSRPPEDILHETERFAREGYKEIVVTGIEVASYGKDLPGASLTDVLCSISSVAGIERVRLSSAPPGLFTGSFVSEIKKMPKICPHFHVSLQSGCDETLKRMNRKYTSAGYRGAIDRILSAYPDAGITTDIITGFPGETEREFEKSYELVKSVPFSRLHVFPYSPRSGTPAADYKNQVSDEIKKTRAKRMAELGRILSESFARRFINESRPVLFESETVPGASVYEGYTDNYIRVRRKSKTRLTGEIVEIIIKRSDIL